MARASGRWASSARRACVIPAPLRSSTARRRPSRAFFAILTRATMTDEALPHDPDGSAAPEPNPETAALERERDDYYDRLLRKTAEFDNYRKRIERERREQADQTVTDMLQELLLIVDDFDRALTVDAGEGGGAYQKGVELIYAKLNDLLKKYGVRPFESLGADFDPN